MNDKYGTNLEGGYNAKGGIFDLKNLKKPAILLFDLPKGGTHYVLWTGRNTGIRNDLPLIINSWEPQSIKYGKNSASSIGTANPTFIITTK